MNSSTTAHKPASLACPFPCSVLRYGPGGIFGCAPPRLSSLCQPLCSAPGRPRAGSTISNSVCPAAPLSKMPSPASHSSVRCPLAGYLSCLRASKAPAMPCPLPALPGRDMDFYLQRPRSFSAICDAPGSVWRVSRHALERMAREQPQASVTQASVRWAGHLRRRAGGRAGGPFEAADRTPAPRAQASS